MEEVERPADLERAGGVVVLVLDVHLAAYQAGQLGVVGQVRPVQIAADDLHGLDDAQ